MQRPPAIRCEHVTTGYPGRPLMGDVNFEIQPGQIVFILGSSGCGKSTLIKHIIGQQPILNGEIYIHGEAISTSDSETQERILRSFGVMYQGGALFGNLTLLENVMLPLEEFSGLPPDLCEATARLKLRQVGLLEHCDAMPADISGGMKKRAAIARAMALEPSILFLDEPSAGLDPITSANIDALIYQLSRELGMTIVIVSHELASIEAIADTAIFLDKTANGVLAQGKPEALKNPSQPPIIYQFFNRCPSETEKGSLK